MQGFGEQTEYYGIFGDGPLVSLVPLAPVVQRPENVIPWITDYPYTSRLNVGQDFLTQPFH